MIYIHGKLAVLQSENGFTLICDLHIVRDNDEHTLEAIAVQITQNLCFRLFIHVRSCFVQNKYVRILENGPRQANELPLTRR